MYSKQLITIAITLIVLLNLVLSDNISLALTPADTEAVITKGLQEHDQVVIPEYTVSAEDR